MMTCWHLCRAFMFPAVQRWTHVNYVGLRSSLFQQNNATKPPGATPSPATAEVKCMLVYQCQRSVQITVILKCSETWPLADYRLCVVPEAGPTSISMIRPTKKEKRLTPKRKSSLRFLRRNTAGYMSTTAVTRLSTHTNWWGVGEKKGALVQFTTNTA